ncbi:MAG: hypothetical protein LIP12_10765 [Clostridiales bacterium]|nr:hypothetical protein [Clostridiales bacterium]
MGNAKTDAVKSPAVHTGIPKNSTKQAAETAYTFLLRNQGLMSKEELHALQVLIAAADQQPDWTPETWACDTYCRKVRHVTCEGRLSSEGGAEKRCPYLEEMLY